MNEAAVKDRVRGWLKDEGFDFIWPEFVIEGGRLDYLAARWLDDGQQLDLVGVECKGETNAAEVWAISNGQLAMYSRSIPRLYFACSRPRDAQMAAFTDLCRLSGVGFVGIDGTQAHAVEPPSNISTRLDSARYLDVRCRSALFCAFEDSFGKNWRGGENWRSTPEPNDRVQWSAWMEPAESRCYLAANLENARRAFHKMEPAIFGRMVGDLPAEARSGVLKHRQFGLGRRATVPISLSSARDIAEEMTYFTMLANQLTGRETLAFWAGLPIWSSDEVLSRSRHRKRMERARAHLDPIHGYLQD